MSFNIENNFLTVMPVDMSSPSKTLPQLRDEIDSIDRQIADLIRARADCAHDVGEVKKASGEKEVIYYRPEREAQVLRNVMRLNEEAGGRLKNEEMARLFREIMSACLALEKPISVAFLGPEGTFTQEAVYKHFGHSAVSLPMSAIDEVFREVESGNVNYGVVPVENSTEGVVTHTLDSFLDSNIHICGEVVLRIHQNLMVSDVTHRDKITRIYSHPQSLAQCRKWLDLNYPSAERIPVSSNADAAKRIKGEWNSAAIASVAAADLYDLTVVDERIEDEPDNATRFIIIGTQEIFASGEDKTSLIVAVRNKPGALHDILEPFHRFDVDMTRLQSRPSKNSAWSYVFFMDVIGHSSEEHIQQALKEVAERAAHIKILGSYPIGVL